MLYANHATANVTVNVPVQVQLTPSQSHLTMYSLTLPGSV